MIISPELLDSTIKSLSWLTADAKWRYDEAKGQLDDGSQGGYSEELTEALQALKELQEVAVSA